MFHLRKVGLLATVGEDAGAKLYDDARGILEQVRTHAVSYQKRQAVSRRMSQMCWLCECGYNLQLAA